MLPGKVRATLTAKREELPIKGKGQMTPYLVQGRDIEWCEGLWRQSPAFGRIQAGEIGTKQSSRDMKPRGAG